MVTTNKGRLSRPVVGNLNDKQVRERELSDKVYVWSLVNGKSLGQKEKKERKNNKKLKVTP
jgi:hypothetical protein